MKIVVVPGKRIVCAQDRQAADFRIQHPDVGKKCVHIQIQILVSSFGIICHQITPKGFIHIQHVGDGIIVSRGILKIPGDLFNLAVQIPVQAVQHEPGGIKIGINRDENHGKQSKNRIPQHDFRLLLLSGKPLFHNSLLPAAAFLTAETGFPLWRRIRFWNDCQSGITSRITASRPDNVTLILPSYGVSLPPWISTKRPF